MRKFMTGLMLSATIAGANAAWAQDPICGDVNDSSTITSVDALLVLRRSVDQPVTLDCSAFDEQLDQCASGTATPGDVVHGKTFSSSAGVGLVGTMPRSQPLKTGATSGVDGELQAGAPRSFTDNGDGTVTDNTTGLMWEKKDDAGGIHDKDNVYNWESVRCKSLLLDGTIVTELLDTLNDGAGFAGYTDWRMPNRRELESLLSFTERGEPFDQPLVDPKFYTGCTPGCTVTTCSCTAPLPTWTSTDEVGGNCLAYVIDFYGLRHLGLEGRGVRGTRCSHGVLAAARVYSDTSVA